MSGASAVTVTCVLVAPSSSVVSICLLSEVCSRMPLRSAVLNPAAVICTLYRPGVRNLTIQFPWLLVLVSWRTLVSSEITTTSAAGTTAPCPSRTRPLSVARVSCAERGGRARHSKRAVATKEKNRLTLAPWRPPDGGLYQNDVCAQSNTMHHAWQLKTCKSWNWMGLTYLLGTVCFILLSVPKTNTQARIKMLRMMIRAIAQTDPAG